MEKAFMNPTVNTVDVNVVLEIATEALQAIVENAKQIAGRNEKGHYMVDTADKTGEVISRFLMENDFTSYAKNPDSYK